MAAINIIPYLKTTSTAAGTTTIDHDYTVPASKRWIVDYIEIILSVANANNDIDIKVSDSGGAYANIIPQFDNVNYSGVHLSSYFPRAIELEASDVLRIEFTRGTSTTVQSNIYLIERDI